MRTANRGYLLMYRLLFLGMVCMFFSCQKGDELLKPETTKPEPSTEQTEQTPLEALETTNDVPIETRIAYFDEPDIRTGPGFRYRSLKDTPILKGQKIFVVDTRECWICFTPDTNASWKGWTHRFLTRPVDEYSPNFLEQDIQYLLQCDLLASIDPTANEALVKGKNWNDLTPQIQEGIGRALAFYCGYKKGTGLNWVEIGDAETHQRLAKYSENMGFKRMAVQ